MALKNKLKNHNQNMKPWFPRMYFQNQNELASHKTVGRVANFFFPKFDMKTES